MRPSLEPHDSRAVAAKAFTDKMKDQLMRIAQLATAALVSTLLLAVQPGPALAETLIKKFGVTDAAATTVVDHSSWSALLESYVIASDDGINRVRYADFKRDGQAALKTYVKTLEAVDVAKLSRPEQIAFWANLYNAKTIDIVLDAYPVKSIKDISLGGGLLASVTGGPWKAKVLNVSGESLSLDDIEHGILRPIYKDARVHYAVNCASIGCPNLMREAFTGAKLDTQLDAGARAYVNTPRGISVAGGAISASSIYKWFVADFGGNDAGVLAHVRKYADPALKQKLAPITAISGYDYNWSLNDATGAKAR